MPAPVTPSTAIPVTRKAGAHQHYQGTSENDVFVQRAEDFVAAAAAVKAGAPRNSQYNVILGGTGDADTYQIVHTLKGEFPRHNLRVTANEKGVVVLMAENGAPVAALAADMERLEVKTIRGAGAYNASMVPDGMIQRIELDDIRKRMVGKMGTLSVGNDGALLTPWRNGQLMLMETIVPIPKQSFTPVR